MVANDLMIQGVMTSAAMVLTYLSQNIPLLHSKGLNFYIPLMPGIFEHVGRLADGSSESNISIMIRFKNQEQWPTA